MTAFEEFVDGAHPLMAAAMRELQGLVMQPSPPDPRVLELIEKFDTLESRLNAVLKAVDEAVEQK